MTQYEYTPLDGTGRRRLYKRLLLRGLIAVIVMVLLTSALPKVLPSVAPFLIALLTAMALNPLVNRLHRRVRIHRRVTAFVLTFFVVGAFFILCGWLVNTIIVQSVSLASNVNTVWSYAETVINYINDKLDWFSDLMPAGSEITLHSLTGTVYSWLQSASKGLLDSTLAVATEFTSKISNILIAFTITLLAIYFTIADYPMLSSFVSTHTERHLLQILQKVKSAVKSALGGYLRAQFLLALLAFCVMFAGLALCGQRYSLLIAMGLGIVDFLPIVGTIAVLIPWAIVEFLAGATGKALYLLVLAVGFFVLRKAVEPKIVGSQTGLHPLVALASIYAGMKIAGVWGAILGPVVVMIGVNIYHSGLFEATIADLKDLYHLMLATLQREHSPEDQQHH